MEEEEEGKVGKEGEEEGKRKEEAGTTSRAAADPPTYPRAPVCVAAPGSGARRAGLRDLLTWAGPGASASSAPRAS